MGTDRKRPDRASGLPVACACCLAVLAGCSSDKPRGEVEGTVRAGGKPLANVLVTFLPDPAQGNSGQCSRGTTDAEGRYRLRGEDGRSGSLAGTHRIVVEDMAIYAAPRDADGMLLHKPAVRFRATYGDPLRTPLSREVRAGAQTVDLELEATP